jgi:Mg-chelatase subunit ChlD
LSPRLRFLLARDPHRTRALIVLSDGKDIRQSPSLEKLFDRVDQANRSGSSILVFAIGYGSDAEPEVLHEIAKRTNGNFYKWSPGVTGVERNQDLDSIRKFFTELATFL